MAAEPMDVVLSGRDEPNEADPVLAETLQELESIILDIVAQKQSGQTSTLPASVNAGMRLFTRVREAHRSLMERSEAGRNDTVTAKLRLDSYHLDLQSLEYEKQHLRTEIQRCREFKFDDVRLGLVAADALPPDYRGADMDEHALMLSRLAFEKKERTQLVQSLRELETSKSGLEVANRAQSFALSSLRGQLAEHMAAMQPLLARMEPNKLELLSDAERSLSEALPAPLYTLFANVRAYIQAHSLALTHTIAIEDGRQIDDREADEAVSSVLLRLVLTLVPGAGDRFTTPLAVVFTFQPVHAVVLAAVAPGPYPNTLLSSLWPADTGLASPNPASRYLAGSLPADPAGPLPFLWAQRLSGLRFEAATAALAGGGDGAAEAEVDASQVRAVLVRLRTRLSIVRDLESQLASLAAGSLPVQAVSKLCPLAPRAALAEWIECAPTEWPAASALPPLGISTATSAAIASLPGLRLFRVRFERDAVSLTAWLALSSEYPVRPPLFRVALPDAQRNAARTIETELNVYVPELASENLNGLLGVQLRRLQFAVDVLAQAGGASEAMQSLVASRLSLRAVRGRNREPPLSFDTDTKMLVQRSFVV